MTPARMATMAVTTLATPESSSTDSSNPTAAGGHQEGSDLAVAGDDQQRGRGQQRQRDEQDGVVAVPQP